MKLHILGCGDAFGSGGRNQSGYLFEGSNCLFLVNCGPTLLLAMKRAGFDPNRLDAILLSHLHGDHCAGLPFFFIEYLYHRAKTSPLIVAGPPGTEATTRQLFELMYGGGNQAKPLPPIDFQILHPDQTASVGELEIYPFRVPHQVDKISLGLRIHCDGKKILFSGDSLRSDVFIEQSRGVDLFLCECSFYRQQPGMHVNYPALQANRTRLGCNKLVLTHLGEELLQQRDSLIGIVAEDGMVLEI
jgi:ribonuclease BN (tRNA processing enzyme)